MFFQNIYGYALNCLCIYKCQLILLNGRIFKRFGNMCLFANNEDKLSFGLNIFIFSIGTIHINVIQGSFRRGNDLNQG